MHNLSKSLPAFSSSSKEIMNKMEETLLSIRIHQMLPQTSVGDKDSLASFCHLPSAVTSVLRLEMAHQGHPAGRPSKEGLQDVCGASHIVPTHKKGQPELIPSYAVT